MAEEAGFEPACPLWTTRFPIVLVMTTSILFRMLVKELLHYTIYVEKNQDKFLKSFLKNPFHFQINMV